MFTSVSYSFVGRLAGHFPIICFNYVRHSTPSLVAVLLYLPLLFMGRLSSSPSLVQLFTGSFLLMSWSFNMLYHASEQESNIEAWSPYSLQLSVLFSSANHHLPYYCPPGRGPQNTRGGESCLQWWGYAGLQHISPCAPTSESESEQQHMGISW